MIGAGATLFYKHVVAYFWIYHIKISIEIHLAFWLTQASFQLIKFVQTVYPNCSHSNCGEHIEKAIRIGINKSH